MDINKLTKDISSSLSDLLDAGGKDIVGLDLGLSSVKASVISKTGKGYKITKFASVDLPEGAFIEDEIQKEDEVIDAIKKVLKKAKISTKNVCIGLSGPNTVVRKLQVAGGSDEEVEDQVSWEAEQYLPFNIEDSSLDYHIVGENIGGGVDVIVAAVKKDILLNYKELCEKAGLKVKIIELGTTAILNIFELVMKNELEDETQSWIVIDFGAQKTDFIIYKGGKIAFSKEVAIGGVMITEEIQRQMGVNYVEAEDLKITGDESGNLPEEILQIVDDVVEAFFSEIKKTIDFYTSSTSDESIVGCVVTGGGVLIPGMMEGLEALLGVEIQVLNPFNVFEVDKKIDDETRDFISIRGVEALGLAIREV